MNNDIDITEQIKNEIKSNDVILFMKGTPVFPMCGFSATIVNILNHYKVEYEITNVLEDPNIRVELSKHSNWPTIPQLFVNGELIGGCDIVLELESKGELREILKHANT